VLSQPKIAAWMDITIPADPLSADATLIAVLSLYPTTPRDTTLDQWLSGETSVVLKADAKLLSAGVLEVTIFGSVFDAAALLLGRYVSGTTIVSTSTLLVASLELRVGGVSVQSSALGEPVGSNWLRWSKIGSLDFTIDQSNIAGQMPLPTHGAIYQILQRDQAILVYGRNGVFSLNPVNMAFGYKQLLHVGLKSKQAVIDTGDAHYFIDALARLWTWDTGPQLLDYREWLGGLSSPVLSFNPNTRLLYLCDGTLGYVYNVDSHSFGKGPATVTGIDSLYGSVYVVASGTMTIPAFAITTDITDFGTRKMKSIQSLEIAADTTLTLQAAIDYRHDKAAAFLTTSWQTIDRRGQVFIACLGSEFRFLVKATSAGVFHVDSLIVNGVVHAH
jgi:hypothetical protein